MDGLSGNGHPAPAPSLAAPAGAGGAAAAVEPVSVLDLPRLPPARKAALAGRVLRAYVPALRRIRSNDLPAMVAHARERPATRPRPRAAEEHLAALRLGRATALTLRLLPTDSRCLVRSLVVLRLLAEHGIPGRLVIGVRPAPDFLAHAWVEHAGRPVLPTGGFSRLLEL